MKEGDDLKTSNLWGRPLVLTAPRVLVFLWRLNAVKTEAVSGATPAVKHSSVLACASTLFIIIAVIIDFMVIVAISSIITLLQQCHDTTVLIADCM